MSATLTRDVVSVHPYRHLIDVLSGGIFLKKDRIYSNGMNKISNIYSGIMLFRMRLKKPASISRMSGRVLIRKYPRTVSPTAAGIFSLLVSIKVRVFSEQ